jgi:uncharacterized protein (TIGR02391 family)
MQSLATSLSALEHLKDVLDRYKPIKYSSTDESRALSQEIPQVYGLVEEVYKRFAGSQRVEVVDGKHKNVFSNYFEAGYLSGRTIHATEGYKELLKVIGRVRAEVAKDSSATAIVPDPRAAWSLLHSKVQAVAAERFNAGHYADSVEAALKALNNEVRAIARGRGAPEMDGAQLMHTAFSPKSPIIVLADLSTQSGRDMQQGYMEMFAGAMSAIRNPKAHDNVVISSERAIHLLFVVSTLWHTLEGRL